jgi:hypothetical protein
MPLTIGLAGGLALGAETLGFAGLGLGAAEALTVAVNVVFLCHTRC